MLGVGGAVRRGQGQGQGAGGRGQEAGGTWVLNGHPLPYVTVQGKSKLNAPLHKLGFPWLLGACSQKGETDKVLHHHRLCIPHILMLL